MIPGPLFECASVVRVENLFLGARVYVYPGARIGQEGFSFARIKAGFLSVPQLRSVLEASARKP